MRGYPTIKYFTGETGPKFNASNLDYRTDVGSTGEASHLFHELRTGYLEVARAGGLTPSCHIRSSLPCP